MPYYFTPPTVRERMNVRHGLFARMHINTGISVLQFGSQFKQYRDPPAEEVEAADRAFLGGRTYPIEPALATLLANAGYANYISLVDNPPVLDVDFQFIGSS